MKLIVGLGNPGPKYANSRHNIGFNVVDRAARAMQDKSIVWQKESKFKAEVFRTGDLIFVKPQTYMNLSGVAVSQISQYYKILPDEIYIVHDDLDLPLGKIRIRSGGASAGHNGVQSIIEALNTDKFVRIRLGIGRGKENQTKNSDQNLKRRSVIDFVLSRFRQSEAGEMRKLIHNGAAALTMTVREGMEKAMNYYN